jgi:hypothetical protein
MRIPFLHGVSKKALLVVALAMVVGGGVAFAQFVQPSITAPNGNVASPLNVGSAAQIMSSGFWVTGLGASIGFSISGGASTWANESNVTTMRVQQLCISGACITAIPSPATRLEQDLNGSSCNGYACMPDAFTAAKVCNMYGYTHVLGTIPRGRWSNVCLWDKGAWNCGTRCTTSCDEKTLTHISCDNDGVSRTI